MVISLPYNQLTNKDIKHFYSSGRKASEKPRGSDEPSFLVLARQKTNTALYTEIMGNMGREFKDNRRTLTIAPAFRAVPSSSFDDVIQRLKTPTAASSRMSRHMRDEQQDGAASPRCTSHYKHWQLPWNSRQRSRKLSSNELSASLQRLAEPTFSTRVRNQENKSMYRVLHSHRDAEQTDE